MADQQRHDHTCDEHSNSMSTIACTPDNLQDLSDLFKVLGDKTRLGILYILSHGECSVSEIADQMDMGQSAISHQLRILRQTRLVAFRKEGKMVHYSLDDEHVEALIVQGLEHVMHD